MKPFYYTLLALTCFSACRKRAAVPECIEAKIAAFSNTACPQDASVKEYAFQGRTVFTFTMGSCGGDLAAPVYNEDCKLLGALGGIMGNTQINGEEFSRATFVRTVWNR